jgi:hypothetical protein
MGEDDKGSGKDVRSELNSLWKSTIDQFDELKNVVVRGSNAGKAKLDSTFLKRQRDKLLAEIGEELLAYAEGGGFDLPEGVAKKAERLTTLEDEISEAESQVDRLLRPDDEDQPDADQDPDAKA